MRVASVPWVVVLVLIVHSPAAGQDLARGRRIFESQCSRCHGITGGGAMGPSLRRPVLRRAPNDEAFVALLTDGLYEKGMPAAWQLNAGEVRDVIAFVRSLGRSAATTLTGDSARGRTIYEGKGGCATCHLIDGLGGAFGPELTTIGIMRGAEYLREALVSPGAALPMGAQTNYPPGQLARYLPVRAAGERSEVTGVRVNEDPFTIQIRTQQGELRSVRKLALDTLEKHFGQSLMPSYRDALSPRELDDLVAFLASLRGAPIDANRLVP